VQDFIAAEAASGVVLVVALMFGLTWFNIDSGSYGDVWGASVALDFGPVEVHKSVSGWVESGLMAVFFFVIGLELKREIVVGELRDPKVAAVPILAAVGGMVVPAVIYFLVSAGTGASRGWGVPVATDIALVLGLLALLGSHASSGLKVFMLAVAIVDDLLGIAAIALFYTDDLRLEWLAGSLVLLGVTASLIRVLPRGWCLALGGATVWYCTYRSGVKAALAGAAIGLVVPATAYRGRDFLNELEHRVHPWSAFVVLPLFGITSASISVAPTAVADALTSRVTWAVIAGAVAGKFVGITATTLVLARGSLRLPGELSRSEVVAGSLLGGVGFSVALFIASAAFGADPSDRLAHARMGVLFAGVIAAALGAAILTLSSRGRRNAPISPP
jgi:NhaA family Na+:H+ antiporter